MVGRVRAREEVMENAGIMARPYDSDPDLEEELFKQIVKYLREKQG